MMDWAPFDGTSDLIQDNSLLGGDMATQYLIDKGYTRIACITGPLDKTPARLRLEGYLSAMARAGLAIPDTITGDFEFNGGFEAMQKLLAQSRVRRRCLLVTTRWRLVPIRRCIRPGYAFR
jgi:LacI family transcriptional regulator